MLIQFFSSIFGRAGSLKLCINNSEINAKEQTRTGNIAILQHFILLIYINEFYVIEYNLY